MILAEKDDEDKRKTSELPSLAHNYHPSSAGQFRKTSVNTARSTAPANQFTSNKYVAGRPTYHQKHYKFIRADLFNRTDLTPIQKKILLTVDAYSTNQRISSLEANKAYLNSKDLNAPSRSFKSHLKELSELGEIKYHPRTGLIEVYKAENLYRISGKEVCTYSINHLYIYLYHKLNRHLTYSQVGEQLNVSRNDVSTVMKLAPLAYKAKKVYIKKIQLATKLIAKKVEFWFYKSSLKLCTARFKKSAYKSAPYYTNRRKDILSLKIYTRGVDKNIEIDKFKPIRLSEMMYHGQLRDDWIEILRHTFKISEQVAWNITAKLINDSKYTTRSIQFSHLNHAFVYYFKRIKLYSKWFQYQEIRSKIDSGKKSKARQTKVMVQDLVQDSEFIKDVRTHVNEVYEKLYDVHYIKWRLIKLTKISWFKDLDHAIKWCMNLFKNDTRNPYDTRDWDIEYEPSNYNFDIENPGFNRRRYLNEKPIYHKYLN